MCNKSRQLFLNQLQLWKLWNKSTKELLWYIIKWVFHKLIERYNITWHLSLCITWMLKVLFGFEEHSSKNKFVLLVWFYYTFWRAKKASGLDTRIPNVSVKEERKTQKCDRHLQGALFLKFFSAMLRILSWIRISSLSFSETILAHKNNHQIPLQWQTILWKFFTLWFEKWNRYSLNCSYCTI